MKLAFTTKRAAGLLLLALLLAPNAARAGDYTFTTLAGFGTDGTTSIVIGPDGDIYGIYGEDPSSFYRLDRTGVIETLASFGSDTGSLPAARLTADALGNIYGTTSWGGANGFGTVYRFDAQTEAISTVANLDASLGRTSFGVVLDALGNIYGIANNDSDIGNRSREVFKIDRQSGLLSTIASIPGSSNHENIALDAAGNIYVTSVSGGIYGLGTIYQINALTGEIATIHSFGAENAYAYAPVTFDAQGNLYGTTRTSVYSIDSSGVFHTLAVTAGNSQLGENYGTVAIDTQGNLYFTTSGDSLSGIFGTIQRIDGVTGLLETLFTFDESNGGYPGDDLVIGTDGSIYGTTREDTGMGYGTVFRLSPAAAVPEPTTIAMLGVGAIAVGIASRRRRR